MFNNNPIQQLIDIMNYAKKLESQHTNDIKVMPYNAASLSTCIHNKPKSRYVLIKYIQENCLYFFTNYESNKAIELQNNSSAALLFYYPHLNKQVRVEGNINLSSSEMSDKYFQSRPYGSQAVATASMQSRELISNEEFESTIHKIKQKHPTAPLPRPSYWGGYEFQPEYFEFWTEQNDRKHNRICYTYNLNNKKWTSKCLYP